MIAKIFFRIITIVGLFCFTTSYAQIIPTNNFIGIDISTQPQDESFTYDSCFALGTSLGMSVVGLFQNWDSIETAPNTFDLSILDIANIYYPAYNMPLKLTITPIHTNNLEVPSDLTSTAFNNPVLISRFKTLLDSLKAHIPNVTLSSLVIGSEHDVYMGTNATLWSQYTTFYDSVSVYAKTLWPGLKVASELTFSGINTYNTFAQALNTNSDYIGISYYPLNNDFTVKPVSTIPTDFATLVGLYPSKPLYFYQYGYPSSPTCNSSESQQAQFISQTFTTWDTYASNVKMINFTWLHDLDTAAVNYYGTYYGITDTIFLEFLRTIGLRTWNEKGADKASFTELKCQAKLRGYNNLNINCTTSVEDINSNENNSIILFPNPVQSFLNIETTFDLKNANITIYNALGQVAKRISNINDRHISIEMADMMNGVFFVDIQNDHSRVNSKFIIIK
jgi:hypothetical protein